MSQAWKMVKPHIPLIRFRKGGLENGTAALKSTGNPPSAPPAATAKGQAAAQERPVIEDYQLPPRYRRQALDPKEIDAINSGGAY